MELFRIREWTGLLRHGLLIQVCPFLMHLLLAGSPLADLVVVVLWWMQMGFRYNSVRTTSAEGFGTQNASDKWL